MLKKTIKYTDYNGNECTEDFYFNLSKAEIAEMEVTTKGGLEAKLDKIVKNRSTKGLLDFIKETIHKAYGIKSEDGKRFSKSEEATKEFEETAAYDELLMEVAFDPDKCEEFFNGIIPYDIDAEEFKEAKAKKLEELKALEGEKAE